MTIRKPGCLAAILIPVAVLAALYFWLVKWPSRDPAVLQAIRVESVALMAKHSGHIDIPEAQYPPAIARLGPEGVWVTEHGVTIMIQSEPDGGYMYFIPRTPADAPRPWAAITDLGYGVYWISRH